MGVIGLVFWILFGGRVGFDVAFVFLRSDFFGNRLVYCLLGTCCLCLFICYLTYTVVYSLYLVFVYVSGCFGVV